MEHNEKHEIVHVNSTPMVVAEIESQIATAKQYPRNIAEFKDEVMTMANLDQATAESCLYAIPRGGKSIIGRSIRFAEISLSCYGNAIAKAEVTGEDEKYVYATGMCRDLEKNVAISMTVKRRITDKNGNRFSDDMIVVTSNACCAIAVRNAILSVVPSAYTKEAFEKVKLTAVGKAESFANRRATVLERLQKMGVDEKRVLNALKRASVDELTINDVTVLIGLGTAVHDGDTTLDEAFPEPVDEEQKPGAKGLEKRLASKDAPIDTTGKDTAPASASVDDKKAKEEKLLKDAQAKADKKNKKTKKKKEATKPKVQTCRVCGCTDEKACVDKNTGETCTWVEEDLCSRCLGPPVEVGTEPEEPAQDKGYVCNACGFTFPSPMNANTEKPLCTKCLSSKIKKV